MVLALDGLKTVAWYLGDAPALATVVQELEPLLRARGDAWLMQWVVFESAFVPGGVRPVGRGRGDLRAPRPSTSTAAAASRPTRATSGPTTAGWPGSPATSDGARRLGRRAVEDTSAVDHPWWHSWAAGLLAATLVETGDRAEAEVVARAGLATRRGTARPGRLLCAATLAALTGEETRGATDALARVDCPPGQRLDPGRGRLPAAGRRRGRAR